MYRNPLYNGNYSDYNLLKNQQDKSSITNKYSSRKLKQGEATEKIKFYEYLTYQQPILDELIYVAERMRNENIQKQKEDFNFIQKLKQEREIKLKEASNLQKDNKEIKAELFGEVPVSKDETPTITTEMEMEFPDDYNKVMEDLIKKQNIQLLTPSQRKLESYSRLQLEEMKRKSEINKFLNKSILSVLEKEDGADISNLFKKEKDVVLTDQEKNIIEAKAFEAEEEKAKRGRAAGQPNEATIQKYDDWKSGKSKDRPTLKQIIAVEAWKEKVGVPLVITDPSILTGVPVDTVVPINIEKGNAGGGGGGGGGKGKGKGKKKK